MMYSGISANKTIGSVGIKVTDVNGNVKQTESVVTAYKYDIINNTFTFTSGDYRKATPNVDIQGSTGYINWSGILKLQNNQFVITSNKTSNIFKIDSIEFENSSNNDYIVSQSVNADGNVLTVTFNEDFMELTDFMRINYRNIETNDIIYYRYKDFHVKKYIYITSVNVGDGNTIEHDKTGEIVIPITYNPTNYTVDVTSVNAVIRDNSSDSNSGYNLVEIKRQTKDAIKLNVHTAASDSSKTVYVDITIVDEDGHTFNKSQTILLYNSFTE